MSSAIPDYSGFQATGALSMPSYLDNLRITTNPPPDIDADGNTLPDDWEARYGLISSSLSDADRDGLDNRDEYLQGLDPLDPDSDQDGMGDGAEAGLGYAPGQSNTYVRIPFHENFEIPTVTNGPVTGQHGWQASRTGAIVQSDVVYEGTQALALSSNGAVSCVLAASGVARVWCDTWVRPVRRNLEECPDVGSNAAASFFFNSTGALVVCSGVAVGRRWNIVNGSPQVSSSQWVRVTVCLDYTSGTWSLWQDAIRVASDLAFVNPVHEFSLVRISAPQRATGYLDLMTLSTNEPMGLDDDGDCMPNAWEREYGFNASDSSDAMEDDDGDGLTNLEEFEQGTNPCDVDTDHDGLVDGHDGVMPIGLFLNGIDHNGDGFADGEQDYGCDPFVADSDGDGMDDGAEALAGIDPSSSTLGQGLLAWYRLDETNGVVIADSSAHSVNGLWVGSSSPSSTVGRMQSALSFDGLTNRVLIPCSPELAVGSNFTVSVWVCPSAEYNNQNAVVMAKEGSYRIGLNNRVPEFRQTAMGGLLLKGAVSIPAASWAQLSVVCAGTSAMLYVDGEVVACTNDMGPVTPEGSTWGLGCDGFGTNGLFTGSLDDVRVYGRALSREEVGELYALGSDSDGNTVGLQDDYKRRAGGGLVIAGDLDGDARVSARDVDRLRVLLAGMTGHVTRLRYDENGNLVRKMDPLGDAAVMTYDPNDRLETTSDANGRVTANEMNAAGAVTAVIDPIGNISRIDYNGFGEAIAMTDAKGNTARMEYNALGKVVRTISPRGICQATTYDELNRVRCMTVAEGTVWEQKMWSFYDSADHLVSNRNNLGVVNEFRYDARGLPTSRIMARGTPAQSVEVTDYDCRGLPVSHTNAMGYGSSSRYDALGHQCVSVDPLGNCARTEYDAMGRVTAEIQPNGRTRSYDYDRWGRRVCEHDGNDETRTDYDPLGRVIGLSDWRGVRSAIFYDAQGNATNRLEAIDTPEQNSTASSYDALNRIVRVVNASTSTVETVYDQLGNVIAVTDEMGTVTRWLYRFGSRLDACIKPDGTVVSNVYDALDRLVEVHVNGLAHQRFSYDGISRMTNAVDFNQSGVGDDAEVGYEYDEQDHVVAEIQCGQRIQRRLDAAGHVNRLTYPSGVVVNRAYDAVGRLSAIKDGSGVLTYADYVYTPNSRIRSITYGSGVVEVHGLDARERLQSLTQHNARCDLSVTLARDANGNVTVCSDKSGGTTYSYDSLNRVTRSKDPADWFGERFRYDVCGNWLCASNPIQGNVNRSSNGRNQYTRVGSQVLLYDCNGSLTNWNGLDYEYDFLARLVAVRSNGMTLVRYGYDAWNRRVGRETAGGHTAWYYDGEHLIDEAVAGSWVKSTVIADSQDTPVVLLTTGVPHYYLRDWRANIAAITDATGQLEEQYRYSVFGRTEVLNGNGALLPASLMGNTWTYAGLQADPETGLLHYRNRSYSPELGRFLQRDPAGYADGMNLYAYAGNNPLLFSDPYGLYRWSHGALDERVGDWLFAQYDQLREIERQRREYEEALRRAEEERQRIIRENEYAARALSQYKNEHPREVRDMVWKYQHLGVDDNEAARLLMSGVSTIPRLGATVGPNDLRRGWWLDYYLRGGQINQTMRDEMTIMGAHGVDEYFARTSEKETRLRDKRKAIQQQYTLASVAVVTTVVSCGAGGALGAALLGTVGVTASTVSFGAFVAGAVAIQGVSAGATTMISHGNIGDFTRSWAINSAATTVGYGAGYGVAVGGADMNVQLAVQSASSTFISEGADAAMAGDGFKAVFRDSAVSFAAAGMMGTSMQSPARGKPPANFGEFVERGAASRFGILHAPVSSGLQGALHALTSGENVGEAFVENSVSQEVLANYLMASTVAPVAGLLAEELASALPGSPVRLAQEPAYREPSVIGGNGETSSGMGPEATGQSWAGTVARGALSTVASHLREVVATPARAVGALAQTVTGDSWLKRSRLINPFSQEFACYQLLDKATDAARIAAGLPFSFLSGDFMEIQSAGEMKFDERRRVVSFNGVMNNASDAQNMKATVGRQYGVSDVVQVTNGSHGYGLGDLLQIVGNELGAIDIAALRGATALRQAAAGSGPIQVVAHSQGTMTFRRALDVVDESSIRQRIAYQGGGPEMLVNPAALGLASAENVRNRETGSLVRRDWVPMANLLPSPARLLSAPFYTPHRADWTTVDSPGNSRTESGNHHSFDRYYAGFFFQ